MPPSDPSFAEETPENHPFCAHFRALSFGHITLTLPPSSLVTRHSLGVSHQPFLNHSIPRSLNHSILLALARPRGHDFGFLILDFRFCPWRVDVLDLPAEETTRL